MSTLTNFFTLAFLFCHSYAISSQPDILKLLPSHLEPCTILLINLPSDKFDLVFSPSVKMVFSSIELSQIQPRPTNMHKREAGFCKVVYIYNHETTLNTENLPGYLNTNRTKTTLSSFGITEITLLINTLKYVTKLISLLTTTTLSRSWACASIAGKLALYRI